jgi:ABC-type phosphate/phosphonate transport system permease subunit
LHQTGRHVSRLSRSRFTREAAVLGHAAAGSAWRSIPALANLYWDQAGLVLLVIFRVVVVTEFVTGGMRGKII